MLSDYTYDQVREAIIDILHERYWDDAARDWCVEHGITTEELDTWFKEEYENN